MRTVSVAIVGVVLALGVAIHEWIYHQNHKFAPGVSGVLVVLALAVACGCFAAADIAYHRMTEKADAHRRYRDAELRRREAADEDG